MNVGKKLNTTIKNVFRRIVRLTDGREAKIPKESAAKTINNKQNIPIYYPKDVEGNPHGARGKQIGYIHTIKQGSHSDEYDGEAEIDLSKLTEEERQRVVYDERFKHETQKSINFSSELDLRLDEQLESEDDLIVATNVDITGVVVTAPNDNQIAGCAAHFGAAMNSKTNCHGKKIAISSLGKATLEEAKSYNSNQFNDKYMDQRSIEFQLGQQLGEMKEKYKSMQETVQSLNSKIEDLEKSKNNDKEEESKNSEDDKKESENNDKEEESENSLNQKLADIQTVLNSLTQAFASKNSEEKKEESENNDKEEESKNSEDKEEESKNSEDDKKDSENNDCEKTSENSRSPKLTIENVVTQESSRNSKEQAKQDSLTKGFAITL